MDMLTVGFLRKYRERPSHCIGGFAAISGLVALGLVASGAVMGLGQIAGTALFLSGVVLLATAIVGLLCGLLGELMIRGGLGNEWRLPITEDTRVARQAPPNAHPLPITTVPLTYQAGQID